MNARTRYFKVFNRELKKHKKYSLMMSWAIRLQLECIPTKKLLRVRKELKKRGTFLKTIEEIKNER